VEDNQMDMFKMMEQAKALKDMMGTPENTEENSAQNNQGDSNSFVKMMQMMEIMKMFNKPNAANNTYEKEVFFDEPIFTPELKSLKAAIPYLDYPHQKNMAMLVKLIEIKKLQEMYDNQEISTLNKDEYGDWRKGMLTAIRPHMTDEKKLMIDTVVKMLEVREMLNKFNEFEMI
jgi:hypothetical protein